MLLRCRLVIFEVVVVVIVEVVVVLLRAADGMVVSMGEKDREESAQRACRNGAFLFFHHRCPYLLAENLKKRKKKGNKSGRRRVRCVFGGAGWIVFPRTSSSDMVICRLFVSLHPLLLPPPTLSRASRPSRGWNMVKVECVMREQVLYLYHIIHTTRTERKPTSFLSSFLASPRPFFRGLGARAPGTIPGDPRPGPGTIPGDNPRWGRVAGTIQVDYLYCTQLIKKKN